MGIDCPHCGEPHPEEGECRKCSFPGTWIPLVDIAEEFMQAGEEVRDALFMGSTYGFREDEQRQEHYEKAKARLKAAASLAADYAEVTGVVEVEKVRPFISALALVEDAFYWEKREPTQQLADDIDAHLDAARELLYKAQEALPPNCATMTRPEGDVSFCPVCGSSSRKTYETGLVVCTACAEILVEPQPAAPDGGGE